MSPRFRRRWPERFTIAGCKQLAHLGVERLKGVEAHVRVHHLGEFLEYLPVGASEAGGVPYRAKTLASSFPIREVTILLEEGSCGKDRICVQLVVPQGDVLHDAEPGVRQGLPSEVRVGEVGEWVDADQEQDIDLPPRGSLEDSSRVQALSAWQTSPAFPDRTLV